MSTKPYDLVIRGGTVATASATSEADIAISGETIAAIGRGLPDGAARDRRARQAGAAGRRRQPCAYRADLVRRAAQCRHLRERDRLGRVRRHHHGDLVRRPARRHAGRHGRRGLSRARPQAARSSTTRSTSSSPIRRRPRSPRLPKLIREGHGSLKVFMTYDRLRLDDEQLLDVMMAARENRALVCVHAENHGMIAWMGKRLLARGYRAPKFHGVSHPRARRGRGVQPAHLFRRLSRPAGDDLPRVERRGHRRDPPRPPAGPEGVRRDLPAISVPHRRGHGQARPRGREVDLQPAAAQRGRPGGAVGGARPTARCRPSRPTTRPTGSTRPASSSPAATRTSRRSPTGCPGSRRACRCCSTPW